MFPIKTDLCQENGFMLTATGTNWDMGTMMHESRVLHSGQSLSRFKPHMDQCDTLRCPLRKFKTAVIIDSYSENVYDGK